MKALFHRMARRAAQHRLGVAHQGHAPGRALRVIQGQTNPARRAVEIQGFAGTAHGVFRGRHERAAMLARLLF